MQLSKEALERLMSLYMLLPTVLCVWLNVTANLGIPCTWIAEYWTIANRGVDASGAVMFVIAFLPTILLPVAAIGGKRIRTSWMCNLRRRI